MTSPPLRRSPRLAEKAVLAAAAPVIATIVTEPPAPAPKPKKKPATIAVAPHPPSTAKPNWFSADAQVRKELLEEAKTLRHQLGQARTLEDFAACSSMSDRLWRVAISKLEWRGADEMFLSDICHWCNWGKNTLLGRVEHRFAIKAAKSYIKCLEDRLDDPYCKYDEDLDCSPY
jgi:hypothetical protein